MGFPPKGCCRLQRLSSEPSARARRCRPQRCPLQSLCAPIKGGRLAGESKCNAAHFCKVKATGLLTSSKFNMVCRPSSRRGAPAVVSARHSAGVCTVAARCDYRQRAAVKFKVTGLHFALGRLHLF